LASSSGRGERLVHEPSEAIDRHVAASALDVAFQRDRVFSSGTVLAPISRLDSNEMTDCCRGSPSSTALDVVGRRWQDISAATFMNIEWQCEMLCRD